MSAIVSSLSAIAPRSPSSAAKVLALFLFAINYKNVPFVWHVRSIYTLLKATALRIIKEKKISSQKLGAEERKQAIAREFLRDHDLSFRATPGDCDWNMHVNNGIYNTTTDFSRYDLVIQTGLGRYLRENKCFLANGGVAFAYLREIPFGAKYWVRSRFVTWDRKWFVIEHRFENFKGTTVYAVGHARMVVKRRDRRTVPPAEVVRTIGFPDSLLQPSVPSCCKAVLEAERALELHGEEDMVAKGAKQDKVVGKETYLGE
ncbi:Thioesterase/thiol ester dehydrase-isomerase [Gonapodya prolifera JEL478]|uniref:Thioesterase/thiol ester dehydrase-isomerase n=1 Tax=Gonapodya prolifera (strain JEL478) TaxID=1344416 RepID=A0A139ARD4_GONPJ|nr:Thioesterase/thiol ester dehydrase-isomerase [Gonapodya prolifera JEL478]|eukprot:KXS19310.1 Thioesterase/thiol ester dehydrase-isomerase [Gonapodya prolifera JEL478]